MKDTGWTRDDVKVVEKRLVRVISETCDKCGMVIEERTTVRVSDLSNDLTLNDLGGYLARLQMTFTESLKEHVAVHEAELDIDALLAD